MKNTKKLKEEIIKIVKEELTKENQPSISPSKPRETPLPDVKPGRPGTDKPKPRRPLGNPNVQPKPKASLKEDEILNKIVTRFKNKKPKPPKYNPLAMSSKVNADKYGKDMKNYQKKLDNIKEDIKFPGDNKWQEGYKTGYKEGFADGKGGKKNKFLNENQTGLFSRLEKIVNNFQIPKELQRELINEIFAAIELEGYKKQK